MSAIRWQEAPLSRVADIERDAVIPENIRPNDIFVGLEHIGGSGSISESLSAIDSGIASTKFRFTPAHVLYGKLRPYLRKIALPTKTGVCSTDILPLLPKRGIIDRKYLFHYLRQDAMIDLAVSRSAGANLPRLSPAILADFPVRFPPIDEQCRIAAILDKADAIRGKRQRALAASESLEHSLFLQSVGPKAEGYQGWALATFEELAKSGKGSMRTGPFGSDLRHSEFVDEGIAVLGIDNAVKNRFAWDERRFITPEKYEKLKRYRVFPGDVIVTIMGTTGRSAVVPDDIPLAITTKHLATITPDRSKVEAEFLSNALHRHPAVLAQIAKANKGAIMDGLNLGIIKSLQIPLPPIDVQRRYVIDLHRLRAMQTKMREQLTEADTLFASLSQRAFRGEL